MTDLTFVTCHVDAGSPPVDDLIIYEIYEEVLSLRKINTF